jgi:hypothetical protein
LDQNIHTDLRDFIPRVSPQNALKPTWRVAFSTFLTPYRLFNGLV